MMVTAQFMFAVSLWIPPVATAAPDADTKGWIGRYVAGGDHAEVNDLWLLADGTFSCAAPNFIPSGSAQASHDEGQRSKIFGMCGNALVTTYTGGWKQTDSIIELEFKFDAKIEKHPPVPSRWMMITWDQRRYLVPEGRIVDFCNEVNFGFEPRRSETGRFPIRTGDMEKAAQGWPTLPEEWRAFLLLEPIQGKLLRIEEDGFGYLDIGEEHGLRAGMVLLAYQESRERACRVKVLCPCGPSARVEILCALSTDDAAKSVDLAPGDIVTTKAL